MNEVVALTGASGFVGSAVLLELSRQGHEVHALTNRRKLEASANITSFPGGLFDPKVLNATMQGCSVAIHLVGIIFERGQSTFHKIHVEGTRAAVDAAKRAGVKRFIHMSALGSRPGAPSAYHRTKFEAEQIVRESGLDWTIFRPSMIHGPEGEFMHMEAKWSRPFHAPPFLFMPYFGRGLLGRGGAGMIQPVFVEDVAKAFVETLDNSKTVGQIYPLGGKQPVSWPQLHQICSMAIVGYKRWVMGVPAWYAMLLTGFVPAALLPFNRDQVIMSQEENTTDMAKFVADFAWEPRGLQETVKTYAGSL